MSKRTPLYEKHIALNARMVEFSGWEMPLHYGSQLEEHLAVRRYAGIFDVSHMNIVDIAGDDATRFLRYLLANDVARIQSGKALYTCMLNPQGGIIDDLIVYQRAPASYRLVLNAGTRHKDNGWLLTQAINFSVSVQPREDLAILALQGPGAIALAGAVVSGDIAAQLAVLKPFHFLTAGEFMAARTGYTGEDGLEIVLPATDVVKLWDDLIGAGASPAGLGARDTLRLEAGLNLYGSDMDETTSPLEANLGWTIAWEPTDRQFIGRTALQQQQQTGISRHLVGLLLEKGGVLRHGQRIFAEDTAVGVVTSGSFAPSLQCSIAMASLKQPSPAQIAVEMRGKLLPVRLVKLPFIRKGKRLV